MVAVRAKGTYCSK